MTESLNTFFQHLNSTFGLNIPLLPLTGWPGWVVTLWNTMIPTPGSPPPTTVDIPGTWPPSPPVAALQITNLQIQIQPVTNSQNPEP